MAGTSKSYLRKTHANQIAGTYTVAHPDGLGTMTVIPQFLYNPGTPTIDADGVCTSSTGDDEYFAQTTPDGGVPGGGPEHGFGGVQLDVNGNPVTKSDFTP
jgi:hypothetical protein